jgi:hypothetical protein
MFKRICPECKNDIFHKTKSSMVDANKKGRTCKPCRDNRFKGDGNPFYGKIHDSEAKNKMSNHAKGRKATKKQKEALRNGSNRKPIYECWLKKYGKDIADKKLIEFKEKQSKNNSGKNNNMYGKPSPQGSGNGWSGWYHGVYFRSLIELSYMVDFLFVTGCVWESAENSKFSIQYIDELGKVRNYFPDYFVNNKFIVEIKPKRLHNSKNVLLKAEAAIAFCKENNYEYSLIEPRKLSDEKILELHNSGEIKFIDRYEKKFKEKYAKYNNNTGPTRFR